MSVSRWRRAGWLTLAWTGVIAVCLVTATWIVNSIDYKNNDYFTFYLAGKLVLEGGDPYAPAEWVAGHARYDVTWIPNQAFVYPLPLALLFTPIALLPLKTSFTAWVALSEGMILVSLYIFFCQGNRFATWKLFLPFLFGLILYRPTILTLVNGQLTAFLLLILAGTFILWKKGRWEWGAFLLSLLILKPNLGAPILFLMVLWLVGEKKYKSILALGMGGMTLYLMGLVLNLAWVQEYLNIGGEKLWVTFGFSPTIWGLTSLVCDFRSPCTLILGGSIVLIIIGLTGWLLVSRHIQNPLAALSLGVTTSLLVTPYSWTYDHLLLIVPIVAIVFSLSGRRSGFLPAALVVPGIALLSLLLLIPDTALGIEILNAITSLVVLLLLLLVVIPWEKSGQENLPPGH